MFNEYLDKLYKLLSIEYNCPPEAFDSDEDIITVSCAKEGRRQYSSKEPFFSMVTLGRNVVITADESIHAFLKEHLKTVKGHFAFEFPSLAAINDELKKYGYDLIPSHHMLLPYKDAEPKGDYPVKWYNDKEIFSFYGDKRFSHALCEKYLPERPDRIAITALDGDEVMAMAGCSEDAPHWQQIGIDVMPDYRGKGLGTYLVTLLKNEIIKRGDIPFYGTAVCNYHSMRIALAAGFKPVWTEINAYKPDKTE